jgi:hypothetical protein
MQNLKKRRINMKISKIIFVILVVPVLAIGFGFKTANTGETKVLLDKTVSVGAEGGSAEVSFKAVKGQKIKIELTAESSNMEPYGFLHKPDGKEEYRPIAETAKDAKNESEFIAARNGRYNLTVFDGSNAGGKVQVHVTAE